MLFTKKETTFGNRHHFVALCEKQLRETAIVRSVVEPPPNEGKARNSVLYVEVEIKIPINAQDLELFEKIEECQTRGFIFFPRRSLIEHRVELNREKTHAVFSTYCRHDFTYQGCKTPKSRVAKWEREFKNFTCIENEVARQDKYLDLVVGCFSKTVSRYNQLQEENLVSKLGKEHGWAFSGKLAYTLTENQALAELEHTAKQLKEKLEGIENNQNAIRDQVAARRQKALAEAIANCEPGVLPETVTGKVFEELQKGAHWKKHGTDYDESSFFDLVD
jgi:hypothetical protein